MKQPWPGMARTIYGDHERFEHVYFSKFNGYYTTGDGKVLINHALCTLHQTLCCDHSQQVEGFKMETYTLSEPLLLDFILVSKLRNLGAERCNW